MIEEILKYLDFDNSDALLFVSQKDDDEIGESRRKILYIAQDDYNADAVFFQLNDKDNSDKYIPQFFIFDNTNQQKYTSIKLSEIHKRLWSSEIVPLYFVLEKNKIYVYNTKKEVKVYTDKEDEINPTDILNITQRIEVEFQEKKKIYSAFLFQNGSFWETDYYKDTFLTKRNPFDILISNLKELKHNLENNLKKELTEEQRRHLKDLLEEELKKEVSLAQKEKDNLLENFIEKTANRIVVFSILIKYLEEKKDENNKSVFTVKGNIFSDKWEVKDFSELIEKGKFLRLLAYLSERFNGRIFELSETEKYLIENLPDISLSYLSNFVNANYKSKSKQLYLWRLYSFKYLPVELISRIYEEFIPDTPGVVYTPPFLVDLLVDECMPLDDYEKFSDGNFKVIDPACGSGIFCVSAYQRLIDWHIINEYKKTKIWNRDIKIETLKNILAKNIFGVDKEQEAVNIAVFSLTLALLEKLTPKQLWEDLDFENTGTNKSKKLKNLKESNIVYDNFFNYLQTADKDFDLVIGNPPFNLDDINVPEYIVQLKNSCNLNIEHKISINNLAILFLDQSIKLLKDDALLCLIIPSANILYNNGSMKYRNHFLQKYTVPQIIDFTHLRRILYNKDVSTCAFFTKKQTPQKNSQILHLISHRTSNEENKIFFNFDTYDFHFIPLQVALTQKYIWKSNLVGGGRLNWIAENLRQEKNTIDNFIKNKKDLQYLTAKHKVSSHEIIDNEIIIIKRVIKDGVIQIDVFNSTKSNNTEINFKYNIGVQFKNKQSKIFKEFYKKINLNIRVYSFFIVLNSVEYLFERETSFNKIDFKTLPYPQNNSNKYILQLSKAEQIWQDDVLNYYRFQGKASKESPLNEITDIKMVQEYAKTFTWLMNLNYNPLKEKSFKTERITITNSYIAVEFKYSDETIKTLIKEDTEHEYQNYFEKQIGRNKKITRIVEYIDFANNKIYYIKSLQKRYWLKSIADRDAMSCFADFGMNNFKLEE